MLDDCDNATLLATYIRWKLDPCAVEGKMIAAPLALISTEPC